MLSSQTPPALTLLIVRFIGGVVLIGSFSLCLSMFVKTWSQETVTTAVVSLTLGALGTLGGILANTRSSPVGIDTSTESTTTETTTAKPKSESPLVEGSLGTATNPVKTEQVNTEENPAIVKPVVEPLT